MTAQILLVLEKWCFYYFLFFFSKILDIKKKLSENQFLNPIVGCCLGKIRGGKSGL